MNKSPSVQERATVCVAMTLLFAAGTVFAQINRPGAGQLRPGQPGQPGAPAVRSEKAGKVEIRRMPPPNKTAMVRTPEFTYNVQNTAPRTCKKPREWALFEVKYETEAKWTDELAFNYHVMTKGKDDEGKEIYSYYTTTIRYIDIPKGDHMSCVALPPSLVERHGEPVAVALEITGKDGSVLDSDTQSLVAFPSKEWWKDSNVLDKPQVSRRNGLLDRAKTPFALVNADDYEVVQ